VPLLPKKKHILGPLFLHPEPLLVDEESGRTVEGEINRNWRAAPSGKVADKQFAR
jgi:hypothetical protein